MANKKLSKASTQTVGDVTGDESIPYSSWQEYEKAVSTGDEPTPVAIPVKINKPTAAHECEFDVDQALDGIDLSFSNYKPSEQAIEFFSIIRLVLGEDPEVSNSLMHYFLIDLVFDNITRDQYPYPKDITDNIRMNPRKIAIIAARMSAKSTVITAYLPIYIAITGKVPNFGTVMFIVGFGDSQQSGAKVQANTIRDFCIDSAFCKDYFESMRFTDELCEFIRKGTGSLKKRSFMYMVKGAAGSSTRGIRYRTERPAMIFFDDIIKNEADANSSVIMKKLHSLIYSDAEQALGRKGKIIAINTPFNKKDPIYSALESGIWTPVCLPICERISLDLEEKDYLSSWPQMHSYEKMIEKYSDAHYGGTMREFNQELMLRIAGADDKLIKDDMIGEFDRTIIMDNIENFTLLITTDFTASNSKKGDFTGIAVWAIGANDDKFLVDLHLRKQTIQEQYDSLFRMVVKWSRNGRIIDVGVELDGQQKLNVFALKKMMIEKNIWFRFAKQKGSANGAEGIMSKAAGGDKFERFKYIMPSFEMKKIWFASELSGTPDMKEMMAELNYLSYDGIGSVHDDGIDLISMLALIDYYLPSTDIDVHDVSDKVLTGPVDIWATIEEEDYSRGGSTIF